MCQWAAVAVHCTLNNIQWLGCNWSCYWLPLSDAIAYQVMNYLVFMPWLIMCIWTAYAVLIICMDLYGMISPILIGRYTKSESILDNDDLWILIAGWLVVDVTTVALLLLGLLSLLDHFLLAKLIVACTVGYHSSYECHCVCLWRKYA